MSLRKGHTRKETAGFSLLELLIVIAILAVIAGVTSAQFSQSNHSVLLKTETRKLLTHLRSIRSKALSQSAVFRVTATQDGRGYSVQPSGEPVEISELITLTLQSGPGDSTSGSETQSIKFYPDGSTSGGYITLTISDEQRAITVDLMTGEVALATSAEDFSAQDS